VIPGNLDDHQGNAWASAEIVWKHYALPQELAAGEDDHLIDSLHDDESAGLSAGSGTGVG
jgi:hypothetical protein